MKENLPKIFITGASGFIGHNLLEVIKDHFKIFALSRRVPKNKELTSHPNITWLQADVGAEDSLRRAVDKIKEEGGVDYVIHLAGYYDFNYDENPEYYHTNVLGTKNILELLKEFDIKRFIFASSVAACEFPSKGKILDETSPANAKFAYAWTKREGEKMVKEYSQYFPCCVVRFAAVFSDWCEYGPLYIFLHTWLTRNWKSRILGGKGESAITYIHVNCLINLLLAVIQKTEEIEDFDLFIVSPQNPVTHNNLFKLATRYFYGKSKSPIHMPKIAAAFGVYSMDILGRIFGKRPFERPWMLKYIDKQLKFDTTYTNQKLGWKPTHRYKIERRLIFMIEHMKSYPYEWQKRNIKALKFIPISSNFIIYEALDSSRDKIISKFLSTIYDANNNDRFSNYQQLDRLALSKDTITVYQFLSVSVRTKDRMSMITYAKEIAKMRSSMGFTKEEVLNVMNLLSEIIHDVLILLPGLYGMEQQIYDEITLTFQLMNDEIEGMFEQIEMEKAGAFSISKNLQDF